MQQILVRGIIWGSEILDARKVAIGPYPQYGWDLPEEIPEEFRKDPGNALRAFPEFPSTVRLGSPKPYEIKAFEVCRRVPELSPPQYGWGRLFFQNWCWRGPLRAAHGIPSSTEAQSEGISERSQRF